MMKKIIFTIVLLFQLNLLFSQDTEWVMRAGDENSQKGISIGTDSLGYIYISGFFNGSITFGPYTLTSSSDHNKDMFVAKMDSTGNYIWAIRGGDGPFDDRALGMHVTPGGDVYLTGTFWGYISFMGTTGSSVSASGNGHDTSLMIKINSAGVPQWATSFGALSGGPCPWPIYDGDDHSYDVKVDRDGFIYVTGFFSNYSATFGSFTLNNPNWNVCQPAGYVGKMDQTGNFIWAHKFDGIKDQRGSRDNRIAIDNFSNVYIVGGFENTGEYGPFSLTSNGSWDVFLFKIDIDGNWIWAKNVGSNKSDRGDGIAIDYCDNIYITGEYRNPMVFEGANASNATDTLSHRKKRDVFVAKITTNGDWVWAKRARSKGTDKPYQMSVDKKMQVFIGGLAGDSMKFKNSMVLSNGDTTVSAFVAQVDGSGIGDWVWSKMGGGPTDDDRVNDVCEDGRGNVYAIGFFEETAVFDGHTIVSTPPLSLWGEEKKDIFIWRLKKDQTVEITPSNCVYIDVQPPGSGTIDLTGTGTILTESANVTLFPCYQSLGDSAIQTFNATPNLGYIFDNWEWNIHNPLPNTTNPNSTVFTYSDDTLIVHFQIIPVDTITYIVQPPGSGTISVDGTNITSYPSTYIYNETSSSNLIATPNTGYNFGNWDFSNNTPLPNANNSNISVTWLSNDTCIVNFNLIPTYDITYLTFPAGAGNIDIDAVNNNVFPTTINYQENTNVSLVANDNTNYTFTHWTSTTSTLSPSIIDDMVNFTVIADDTIIAHYSEVDTLWVITNPPGVATLEVESDIITTTPFMGLYQKNSIIHINAIPNGANVFNQWNLNNNNLDDYDETTYFIFIDNDTLFAHFNNVLSLENLGDDIKALNIYPNVVNDQVTIEFELKEDTEVEIELLDISGRKVKRLIKKDFQKSSVFKKTYKIGGSKGIYFINLKTKSSNNSFKIVKI